jgi:hypothetical protein
VVGEYYYVLFYYYILFFLDSNLEKTVYYCYNYNYYKKFTRQHVVSKHNILNFFEVDTMSQIDIIFSLKNNKRECNLLLF